MLPRFYAFTTGSRMNLGSVFPTAMVAFLEEWWQCGLPHTVVTHPMSTADRRLDFRVIGSSTVPTGDVLFVTGGLHGVEGIAGLRLLTRWARAHKPAEVFGEGINIVVVPTINVWGASRLRRVDEANVDLNRNFRGDWEDLPQNPGYEQLHNSLVPQDFEVDTVEHADIRLSEFIARHGFPAYQAALTGGQYAHANGLFYGGTKPSWSNVILTSVVRNWLVRAKRVIHIDVHTGLGPFGVCEMLCPAYDDDPMLKHAAQIWGKVESPFEGESVSSPVTGHMADMLPRVLPTTVVTSVAIEFGTHPIERVITALRAEQVWHNTGREASRWGNQVQQELLECFCPQDPTWLQKCQEQFDWRMQQAISALRA